MKKIISLIISIMMIFQISAPVMAVTGSGGRIAGNTVTTRPGGTVEVVGVVKNNPGIAALGMEFVYNKSVMQLVKITNMVDDVFFVSNKTWKDNACKAVWLSEDDKLNKNGTFVKLTFRINSNAAYGSYPVVFNVFQDDTININEQKVPFSTSNAVVKVAPLSPVKNLNAVPAGRCKTQISWNKVDGATGYIIYRRVGKGAFSYLTLVNGTTYTDKNASQTDYNFYRVYPYYINNGKRVLSEANKYVYAKGVSPAVTNLTCKADGKGRTKITWSKSKDASGYIIYRRVGNGTFQYLSMTSAASYIDKTASEKAYNFYRIYPYYISNGKRILGVSNKYVYAKGVLPQVTGLKARENTGSISISWNKVSGAEGYIVYRRIGSGSFSYYYMTSGTSITDKKASKTQYNFYRVYPYYTKNGKRILNQQSDYVYGKAK